MYRCVSFHRSSRLMVSLIASTLSCRTLSLCNNSFSGALPTFMLNATWISYANPPYHASAHWHSVMSSDCRLSLQIAAIQLVDVRPAHDLRQWQVQSTALTWRQRAVMSAVRSGVLLPCWKHVAATRGLCHTAGLRVSAGILERCRSAVPTRLLQRRRHRYCRMQPLSSRSLWRRRVCQRQLQRTV
jgi:hypothetical protein